MGVRSRTISLVAVTSIVLWLAMEVVAVVYATRTSNEADIREAIGGLNSSAAAVAFEQERLVSICGDWAPWDDSYDFVQQPTDAYVENNLTEATLVNLGVDFMLFADSSGRIIYAKSLDLTTHKEVSLPDGLARYLASQPALLHVSNPRAVVSGALSIPEGPYLIAAQPIGKSDFSEVPNGTLITGYRVGEKTLSKIEKLTLRSLGIYSSVSPTLPADVRSARSSLDKREARVIVTPDDKTIVAYSLIPGVEGSPGLVMRMTHPRSAYIESRAALIGVGLVMTVFGLVVVAILGITLDRTVLRRLTTLSTAVSEIGRAVDEEARIPVVGNDEISSLTTEINRMLDDLGRFHSEMSYLVDHDPLTGLYNRRYFEHELRREIDEHVRLGAQGAVLWFDLDHFKDINDSLGHAVGDELLRVFGWHLQNETRAYCTVARLGGDEFGMLIPHVEGSDAIQAAARLIGGFSSRTFPAGAHDLPVSASAGVVLYPEHGDNTSDLLARADIAMYDAKAKGGNQVVAYVPDDSRQTEMTARLEAAERILSALREDRLLLYAQPIRSSSGDGALGFELLLRMRDEDGELVFPADIISTAERLGLIRDIDRWVVRRAVSLLGLARDENRDVEFSINLSGSALYDTALLDVLRDEFARTGASPERLIIEMTESTTLANIEGAINFVRALKEIGCRFSLDDFGSEASSYYYLKHLPVDFLKINGSLVTALAKDPADAHFVHAIVEMCRGLKIRTVAEYVDNSAALEAINSAGVDFVQGYHVGHPEPLDVYLGDRFAESNLAREAAASDEKPSADPPASSADNQGVGGRT